MKAEKILTEVEKARAALLDDDGVSAFAILHALKLDAEEEIRREAAKGRGMLTVQKAAEKILKAGALHETYGASLAYAFTDGGTVTVGEPACVIEFVREYAPPLPELPEKERANYPAVSFARVLDGEERGSDTAVALPSAAELKAHITAQKADQKANGKRGYIHTTVTTGAGEAITIDAEKLLTVLCALPSCTARADSKRGWRSNIYFSAETGRGVLLPCRPPKKGG